MACSRINVYVSFHDVCTQILARLSPTARLIRQHGPAGASAKNTAKVDKDAFWELVSSSGATRSELVNNSGSAYKESLAIST